MSKHVLDSWLPQVANSKNKYINTSDTFAKYLFKHLTFTDGNDVGCLGADYCPPECTCTGTIVRCSHAKLTEIPKGIPAETSELYLDVNEIGAIDTQRLKHLKALTRL